MILAVTVFGIFAGATLAAYLYVRACAKRAMSFYDRHNREKVKC